MSSSEPVIRRRIGKSQRQRNGLIQYAKDRTSQNGEDGIIEKIFEILPTFSEGCYHCVDVGAWDGHHLSNSYSLLVDHDSEGKQQRQDEHNIKWSGVLIEADQERFQQLKALHDPLGNVCINTAVSCHEGSSQSLVSVLKEQASNLPSDFEFLSIDVDGPDYWLLHEILQPENYRPKVICIEANPTMPNDLVYIPPRNDAIRHGASLAALVELAAEHGYVLIETTIYNAFFVQQHLYDAYFQELVPDTSIEALHEITMGTSMYQLYDGTIKLWGCKKLLWHRCAIDERQIQVLPSDQRNFPFSPQKPPSASDYKIVDISSYCTNQGDTGDNAIKARQVCAEALVNQLRSDGFALVNGTQISSDLCQQALHATKAFLQDADESVRRSCLTKDRARRGYSPMCTENFASLLGEEGPNDLVRKFRIGPCSSNDNNQAGASPLLRPNIWPDPDTWDPDSSQMFQSAVEKYYKAICSAANAIVCAICDGLIEKQPELATSLGKISGLNDSLARTSILTLLGYRKGTRHKKTQKKRFIHPLVAAHTDVGIITVLLFDAGDCAVLQREVPNTTGDDNQKLWADVKIPDIDLPSSYHGNPTFVVNIADCMSELSDRSLPSTIHRVMPTSGSIHRNCLALFVGLDPQETLLLNGEEITYEEWRKERILKSQAVLKGSAT